VNVFGGSGIPIARVFGIEVRVHPSWVVVLAIIAVGVALELSDSQPEWGDALRWSVAGVVSALFFLSVLGHELAHAFVARRRDMGGGSVTLLFFGGATTAGKEPTRPSDEALVAIAGPLASLGLAVLFALVWVAASAVPGSVGAAIAQVGSSPSAAGS
jgi:Zn-dependent protease